jgi:hypothetical protein
MAYGWWIASAGFLDHRSPMPYCSAHMALTLSCCEMIRWSEAALSGAFRMEQVEKREAASASLEPAIDEGAPGRDAERHTVREGDLPCQLGRELAVQENGTLINRGQD